MVEHPHQFQKGEMVPGTAYRVEELVGSGGMGSVYRVEHAELGRRFVLKALHGHLASRLDLVARLKNEWRALGKLEHPNIVQVTDAGQTESGLPFYVMEHLRGKTLGQLLMEKKRLGAREACLLVVDILAGLHAAHQTGAVHRDIKPPNIFIVEGGRAKLLDFGIAKLRDQSAKVVTAGGISVGTPRYMAPEQASGTVVDGRADIYATALVLYEMVVGKGPFSQIRDPNELVMAHIGQEPERADFREPRVPPELGDLIARWLSKSPDNRPATAEFARRELVALAQSLPSEQATPNEEVTVGGAYEASTVGAFGSVRRADAPLASSTRESPDGPEKTRTSAELETTATIAVGTGDVADEPGEMGAGLVGSVAAPVDLSEKAASGSADAQEPRDESRARDLPGRRSSVTPPPVSAIRPFGRETSRTTFKWIAGTAAVSFLLAWGTSRVLKTSDVESKKGPEALGASISAQNPPSSPERPANAQPEPVHPMAASGDSEEGTGEAPTPSGRAATGEEAAASAAKVPGGRAPGDADLGTRNSVDSGTSRAIPTAATPTATLPRPPKKQAAPGKSASPRDVEEHLPESGLW